MFSPEEIQSNKQLEQCPVISAYEYDNLYFLVHKAYAHFFRNDAKYEIFKDFNFKKIKEFIEQSEVIERKYKLQLIQQFKSLVNKQNFIELSIRLYTGESCFCYIFNRTMRKFEKGLISLAYYIGPFLYGINKYVRENPHLSFNQNMTLYRNIECSEFDYYLYRMNLNHIICFPSIISTSIVPKKFESTDLSKKINNHDGNSNSKNLIKLRMIFYYRHQEGIISPGIIILNNKGKDNLPLSINPNENEVLLFPFTFARIIGVKEVAQKENELEMYFDIINRRQYIEYTLKDDVTHRFKFSDLDEKLNQNSV